MPITTQKAFSYVIVRMNIDMDSGTIACALREYIDSVANPTLIEFDITGADFIAFLDQVVDTGRSRADDTTRAVYQYAVSQEIVAGEIS